MKSNEYYGYIKLPKKKSYRSKIRLDFNANIAGGAGNTKMEGFALRLWVLSKKPLDGPEIGVKLRPEEWLDLINAMKEAFESASDFLKEADGQ
ncbi:MAG TPA: hypothetical protein VFC44_01395 [Candidatus Saccharimonadales bacterium]|nr:hypothetical protein [Candidatus Saccharimonadales bacterium]